MSFGTRLKEMRRYRKMSLEQLAEAIKSSENVIRGYEKSRRMPTSDMLLRLCEELKVHPNFLYQDELSFNPYEESKSIFNKIDNLPVEKREIVTCLVDFLTEQEQREQEQNKG